MLRRTTAAIAITTALAATVPLATATPAAAAATAGSPAEFVIPARQVPVKDQAAVVANETGFLVKGQAAGTYTWYAYGSTRGTAVTPSAGTDVVAGGPNSIAFLKPTGTTTVTFRDVRDGKDSTVTLPAGHTFLAVVGDAVLTRTTEAEGQSLLHWLTLDSTGKQVRRPITALPQGGVSLLDHSGSGALVRVGTQNWFLTPAGKVKQAPAGELHGDWIVDASRDSYGDSYYWSYSAWDTRTGKGGNPAGLWSDRERVLGVVGNELVFENGSAYPLDRTSPGHAVIEAVPPGSTAHALPGDLVVVTGRSAAGIGIHTVDKGGDGKAVATRRLATTAQPHKVSSIAMDNGRLYSADRDPNQQQMVLNTYTMPTDGAPRAGSWSTLTWLNGAPNDCTPDRYCPPVIGVGNGTLVYSQRGLLMYHAAGEHRGYNNDHLWTKADPASIQASGRFAAYMSGQPGATARPVGIVNLENGQKVRNVPVAAERYALSGAWLWRQKSAGVLEAVDVRTGAVVRTEKPTDCDIKALDAWGTSVYWKCDAKAGVYDTSAKKNVAALPAHTTARLGHGFVVWEKDGVLKSTDLRPAGTGTRDVGKPVSRHFGNGWTVDRYAGRIAYRDAAENIHVVDSGVPAPALSVIDRDVPVNVQLGTSWWRPAWYLNKPAGAWNLTIKARVDGAEVWRAGGQAAVGGKVGTEWQGRTNGSPSRQVPDGLYDWTLTVKPADGQGPEIRQTGMVQILTKAAPRDFAGNDGFGDLATLDSKGALAFHGGDGKGGLTGPKVTGTGWPATSTVVPFGDLNKDRVNDVLVRNADGELRAYRPAAGAAVTPLTPSTAIGIGFGQYDVLTSPGGTDLLARKASTGELFRYAADGAGGFKAPVKLAGSFKGYKQLAGAGDLNGDGQGDLLAVDSANTLWRFDGAADGTFKARVQVNGAGWANGRVQLIGVGDITGDAQADIVSRNAAGELLRNSGDGKGGLQATVKIATGFGGYKGVY
ncbi:VCBS repeat-containing protein [Streptomyces sp. NPDC089799]|uniref:FG-GAP repeat domain-containing protein n=1 Tax=Streptomyces sp. NPDC089799 TaxID=3155066 RepID=UPI0034207904